MNKITKEEMSKICCAVANNLLDLAVEAQAIDDESFKNRIYNLCLIITKEIECK